MTFKYDPFGRRIEKISSSGTTIYAYDGDNIIEELNTSGSPTARYTQGLGIDEPLEDYEGGKSYYYHADGVGSIVALTKSTGTAANTYFGYNTFGGMPAPTETVANPFRFTGREWDSETSLYYYRARYYDPLFGRFLSEDPVGFTGGSNFYAYVYNDPADFTDPTGLRYKCNFLGVCSKMPFPRRSKPAPPPPQRPCAAVQKAFTDFEDCADRVIAERLPGSIAAEGLRGLVESIAELPPPTGNPDESAPPVPTAGAGATEAAAGGLADATEEAIRECYDEHPLAALDPRFTIDNVGRLAAPTWLEDLADFFGISPPYK